MSILVYTALKATVGCSRVISLAVLVRDRCLCASQPVIALNLNPGGRRGVCWACSLHLKPDDAISDMLTRGLAHRLPVARSASSSRAHVDPWRAIQGRARNELPVETQDAAI